MPQINLGHPDDNTSEKMSAEDWIKLGGTGIDTAYSYHNQGEVGAAVRDYIAKGGKREDLFITTKIDPQHYAKSCTEETSTQAILEDLRELNMTYVDLTLIHFPCDTVTGNQAVWKGLQQAKAQGHTRAIGVSNFKANDIKALLSDAKAEVPSVNQCELAVGYHDDETIAYCKKMGITYESYSPLRHVDLKNKIVVEIAQAHNVSVAQVCLRWVVQQNLVVATSPGGNVQYAKEDLDIFSFNLTTDEMNTLTSIGYTDIKTNEQANYAWAIIYAILGFAASVISVVRKPVGESESKSMSVLRYGYQLGILLLAFGTGCDNARLFAGAAATSWPQGVWETQNEAIANAMVATGQIEQSYGAMATLSSFCYFSHEVLGGVFMIPGFYLWLVSYTSNTAQQRQGGCCGFCLTRYSDWLYRHIYVVSLVCLIIGTLPGAIGYAMHTTKGSALRYNSSLGGWTLGPTDRNPFSLVGVFVSSGFWILLGAWIWIRHRSYWFFIAQLACLFGQGASAALGDKMNIVSNLCEQVATYSLLALSEWLRRVGDKQGSSYATLMY